jgi:hypothetical protein
VLIRVRAFGLNHADVCMRSGASPAAIPVLGIECAGTVEEDPSGRLAYGTTVIALVGGMARTRNGSYAELVTVPASNVVAVQTALREGDRVLIRGGTSSLGQAAVNIAAGAGASVRAKGRVCLAGFLGGLAPVRDFDPLADAPSGVQLGRSRSPCSASTRSPRRTGRWRRTRRRASSSCAFRAGRPGGGSRPSPSRRPCA